jgi:hypothetical protein
MQRKEIERSENKVLRTGELKIEHKKIIRYKIAEDAELEMEDIKEVFIVSAAMAGDEKFCLLTDARVPLSATPEAREFAANNPYTEQLLANAILINSLPVTLLANFYIRFNKPKVATKLFSDEAKAFSWLQSFF